MHALSLSADLLIHIGLYCHNMEETSQSIFRPVSKLSIAHSADLRPQSVAWPGYIISVLAFISDCRIGHLNLFHPNSIRVVSDSLPVVFVRCIRFESGYVNTSTMKRRAFAVVTSPI